MPPGIQLFNDHKGAMALVATWLVAMTAVGLSTGLSLATTMVLIIAGLLLGVFLLEVKHQDRLSSVFKSISADLRQIDVQLGKLTQADALRATVERLVDSVGERSERAVVDAARQGAVAAADGIHAELVREIRLTYRQVEALLNLYAINPPELPMPSTRGWAASPDLLLTLLELIIREKPKLVVECGSGTSTLWMALTMQRFNIGGRVVSLEHSETYAESTRSALQMHSADAITDVRLAPLENFEIDGKTYPWYAGHAWSDLREIDLLFVDGPPAATGPHARYPAMPLLYDALRQSATVVLDDLIRADEQEVVQQWLSDHESLDVRIVDLEKKAAVLRRKQ